MGASLNGKKIIVGITGSIAAYKTCELIRKFVSSGNEVVTMVTRHALEFITPLTLKTLSGHDVMKEIYDEHMFSGVHHIDLAHWADLVLICPATANIIGKASCAIADDLVTTVILSTRAPVIFAPAMNNQMYENKIVQSNLQKIKDAGHYIIEPDSGFLACGYEGIGRLADSDRIITMVADIANRH
ncbi:MAG: bifunctional phosphopantothenoylcysteine decarboxylase/phosphopantothenate--cysteine ligase CoaBC, partial [Chlamydiota bacterium]|nr:bifunctional phosphopantothenoylcysteine decarboxylase/phosphopantothenate--cysteine ligase CoaBC [Chlamydiota bacterium]